MKKIILLTILFIQTLAGFSQRSMATEPEKRDTLYAKRVFLWTNIYKNTFKLSNTKAKNLLKFDSQANTKYTWGKVLQPIGPIATLGGITLMAVGLRGEDKSIMIDGVNYNYTDRSLKKTLLGLATTALGLCLIESSNELIQHSVTIYNNALLNRKTKISYYYGITPEGNVGLVVKF